jgi:hypothetical protein
MYSCRIRCSKRNTLRHLRPLALLLAVSHAFITFDPFASKSLLLGEWSEYAHHKTSIYQPQSTSLFYQNAEKSDPDCSPISPDASQSNIQTPAISIAGRETSERKRTRERERTELRRGTARYERIVLRLESLARKPRLWLSSLV